MTTQSKTKLFIRGGQTFLHSLAMFNQVANKILFASVLILPVLFSLFFMQNTQPYERYIGKKWLMASLFSSLPNQKDRMTDWQLPNQQEVKIREREILRSTMVQKTIARLENVVHASLIKSGLIYAVLFICIARQFRKRGTKQSESTVKRGLPLVDKQTLVNLIKEKKPISPYRIAGVSLPFNSEVQHIQFVGTTGSGKTMAIRELLQIIRARGERAIIYDKGGVYLSKFFQPEQDILLNPLDERSHTWDVWQECDDKADLEALAEALMPMPVTTSMDPFWVNAARMIFVSAAHELKKNPNRSNLLLLQYLLTKDVGAIHELIKHTESESLVSNKIEKTALNVKAVMATYLKSLSYLKPDGEFFSIRDWMTKEENNGFLFISSNERKHPTLRPLISAWINTAAKELLSLRPKENRRIWFIFDELATLHMLPFLEPVMSESRKFGGCFILGYHGISQLRKIYGHDGASNLCNFCSTRVFLRLNDDVNSEWASTCISTYEIEEVNEGVSYGANTVRDGISISRQVKEKKLVLPSEIMLLNDLEAYLKVKGRYPVAQVDIPYVDYPDIHPEFIEREGEKDSLAREVDALVEKYEYPVLAQQHDLAWATEKSAMENNNQNPSINEKNKELTDFL